MSYLDKILNLEDAIKLRIEMEQEGKKIVFTNGCFDLIHKGHISYLEDARALGDVLFVGLNSDASIQRLKGEGRPLKQVENRAAVLAGMTSVGVVVVFDEDTPIELIRQLNPDVLVKGGDYTVDKIVGADHVLKSGGAVKIINFVPGYSSSRIIQKMRNDQNG